MNKAEGQTISQRDAQVRVEPGAPSAEDLKGKFGRDIFRDFDYDAREVLSTMTKLTENEIDQICHRA